jgi:hypothetical protein
MSVTPMPGVSKAARWMSGRGALRFIACCDAMGPREFIPFRPEQPTLLAAHRSTAAKIRIIEFSPPRNRKERE